MKSFATLAALVSLSAAFPAIFSPRGESPKCPIIPQVSPDGQLPPGTLDPSYMIPVSQKCPDKAFPAGQKAIVTPNDMCTLTRFDIPASAKNKTCSLVMFLGEGCGAPNFEEGPGNIIFAGNLGIRFPEPSVTTWNNQPPHADPFTDAPIIKLGNAYRLGGGPCDYKEGQEWASVGGRICSNDTTLTFTNSNGGKDACPVGFHIIIQ